MRSMPRMSEGR